MTRRLLWLSAALAACASGGGGTTPAPAPGPMPYGPASPEQPATTRTDALRYGPSAVRYIVHRQLHIQQGFGEQVHTQDLGTKTFLTVAIAGPTNRTGYPATFTVDSQKRWTRFPVLSFEK